MCCIIPTDTGTFCELQVYNKIISFAINFSPFSQSMKKQRQKKNSIKTLCGEEGRKGNVRVMKKIVMYY